MSGLAKVHDNTPENTPLWQNTRVRVRCYWQALGVSEEKHQAQLSDRVMERVAELAKVIVIPKQELPNRALEEAQRLLNDWLSRVLQDRQPATLAAARVALLEGAAPGWPERVLNDTALSSVEATQLRSSLLETVPPDAALDMPTQVIEFSSMRHSVHKLWLALQSVVTAFRQRLTQEPKS